MEKFIIHGGKKLKGEIEVLGAKNAALPILAATLLTKEECVIDNIPLIGDVFSMLAILKSLGVTYTFTGKRKIKISTANLKTKNIKFDFIERIRSSVFLFGVLPARLSHFTIPKPGGCSLGARILDPHINALLAVGISVIKKEKWYHISRQKKNVKKRNVVLSEMSVTATGNAILSSVLQKGEIYIFGAAQEHYIQDLCYFLNKMGARISGIGTHNLVIQGVEKLHGAKHFIMYDPIEMGTFIAIAAVTQSTILIRNTIPEFIRLELLKFKEANVKLSIQDEHINTTGWGYRVANIKVSPSTNLKAIAKVHNMPYPGFSSDLLPIFGVLATQAKGVGLIHDWMYEGRLKYIDELKRMGANAFICDPHRALITGPTELEGTDITSFDLRAGVTLIIAALIAKGETVISNINQVDRGYEQIEKRLKKLGANIKRIKS